MKRVFNKILPLAVLGLLLATPELPAQSYNATPGVPVRLWGEGYGRKTTGASAQIQVTGGDFLHADSSGADNVILNGSTTSVLDVWFQTSAVDTVYMEPGKAYSITVNGIFAGGQVSTVALNMAPPLGYDIEIDGERRQRANYENPDQPVSYTFLVRLLGAQEHAFMAAGSATQLMLGRIYWQVGLGGLRNGRAAGSIAIIDPGVLTDWSMLYTPSALQYETPSDEITVLRASGGALRQIIANQAVVDIVTASATAYDISFYHPDQASGSGTTLRTLTGQPYRNYRVEQGGTSTTLKITCTVRDTTAASSWTASVARTVETSLARVDTGDPGWPTYEWTRNDWNTSGQTQVAEQVTTSAGTTADRTDTVVARPGGGGANAAYLARAYHKFTWGEEIVSSTAGSTNGMTTSFDYYDNTIEVGRHGFLKSTVTPGGGWEAYDYWDATSPVGTKRIGTLRYRYRPFGNTPASLTFNATQGEVTLYDFGDDAFGIATRPTLVETRVDNILTAKSSTIYTEPAGLTVNGYQIVQAVRSDYTSATGTLDTITKLFREDTTDLFLRNQVHSVTRPDGVKVSFAYQRGDFNESTKAFTASASGSGSRIATITGIAGSGYTAYDGYDIDDLSLVAGKSTLEVVLRDSRALVRRTESHVWVSNAWQLIGWVNFDYDTMGSLVSRTASNNATSEASYAGGQKIYDIDESGVRTDYEYDAAGRLSKIKKRNAANTAFTTTVTSTYDAAGRGIAETVSGAGTSETVVNSRGFDDAGRLTGETPAGTAPVSGHDYTIEHSYNVAAHTHTTTNPLTGADQTETYALDGRQVSVTGSGVVSTYYTWSVDASTGQRFSRVDSGSTSSPRYQKAWADWLGRTIKTERPGFSSGFAQQSAAFEENFYDDATVGLGRLYKSTSTDSPPTLYGYDALGSLIRSGVDADADGSLTDNSADRITESEQLVESHDSAFWLATSAKTYFPGESTGRTTSLSWQRLTGHTINSGTALIAETRSWDAEDLGSSMPTTTSTVEVNCSTKTVTTKSAAAGLPIVAESRTVNGLATEMKSSDGLVYTSEYDPLERLSRSKNPRHATGAGNIGYTVNAYKTGTGLIESVADAAGNTVGFTSYDTTGRVAWTRNADNKYTRFEYTTRGQLYRQWGDATYPVSYGYDATYGERTSMSTYRSASVGDSTTWPSVGTADTTTWTYDAATGLLWKKTDAASKETELGYNRRGQTATRTLARQVSAVITDRVKATYTYYEALDGASVQGELKQVAYNDGTPTVTYTYDRLGRADTVADYSGTRTFHYDAASPWRLKDETLPAFFGSRVLTRLCDATTANASGLGTQKGRSAGFQLGVAGNTARDLQQAWTFTDQPRFASVQESVNGGGAQSFDYAYVTAGATSFPLLNGYTTTASGGTVFAVTRDYEPNRDLVTRLESKYGTGTGSTVARFDYTHNALGQRLSAKQSGAAYAAYTAGQTYGAVYHRYAYDARGELESSRMYGGDTVTETANELPGRRFEYRYDSLGNRKSSGATGSSDGTVNDTASGDDDYVVNALNQYTARENNQVAVTGSVASNANVAMLGTNAVLPRTDRAWSNPVTPDNTAGPAIGQATVYAAIPGGGSGGSNLVRTDNSTWLVPKRQEVMTYDDDGNLTSDGLWSYQYDGENRLVRMTSLTTAGFGATAGHVRHWIDFKYDYTGRRIEKLVYDMDGSPTTPTLARRFIYDGWNLIAELDGTGATILRSYTWGLDLGGSLSDSSNPGSLLRITNYTAGTPGTSYYPASDGNGNVTSLVNATSGALAAIYEYDPFGNLIRNETLDSTVADNPFRFSTKYRDTETGLLYYGYRYYSASMGRFINQDPIEESGGLNLYGFCGNNGVNGSDYLGLTELDGLNGHYQWAKDGIGVYEFSVPVNIPTFIFGSKEGGWSFAISYVLWYPMSVEYQKYKRVWVDDEQPPPGTPTTPGPSAGNESAGGTVGNDGTTINLPPPSTPQQPPVIDSPPPQSPPPSTAAGTTAINVASSPPASPSGQPVDFPAPNRGVFRDPVEDEWRNLQRHQMEGQIKFIKILLSPAGTMALSTIPGVGEAMDAEVLADPTASTLDRVLAGASLGMSALSDGVLPNYGALRRGLKRTKGVVNEAAELGLMNPNNIRFSQESIKAGFRETIFGSIDDLAAGLRGGKIKPSDVEPIRLVERDGHLITIDNRRLEAFRRAGVNVPARMATPAEIKKAIQQGKFSAGELGGKTIRVRGGKP